MLHVVILSIAWVIAPVHVTEPRGVVCDLPPVAQVTNLYYTVPETFLPPPVFAAAPEPTVVRYVQVCDATGCRIVPTYSYGFAGGPPFAATGRTTVQTGYSSSDVAFAQYAQSGEFSSRLNNLSSTDGGFLARAARVVRLPFRIATAPLRLIRGCRQ